MPRRVLTAVAVWIVWQSWALACPICFQSTDPSAAAGVRAAVAVLVAIVSGVLVGVAVWLRRTGLLSSDPPSS